MPQDAFTLRHLCRELNMLFSGGKINKIVQPSGDKVVFTVYTGGVTKKLLLSVDPSNPRMGVTENSEKQIDSPSFYLLLKKHLLGATISGIELLGFDRIVKISLVPSMEFFDQADKVLFVELMGRYSNVILTENGKILGGNRGINMFDDGVRPLFTGHDYVLPPTNGKLLPTDDSLICEFANSTDVVDTIIKKVQGVAKSTAEWIAVSFAKSKGMDVQDVCAYVCGNAEEFVQYMRTRLYLDEYRPCVSVESGEIKDVFALPYDDGEYRFFDKLYLAEDCYYTEKLQKKEIAKKRDRLNAIINSSIKKATKRLNAILQKQREAEGLEDNRIKGELIIANVYKLKRGDTVAVLDNYYDATKMEIPLDKNKSPSENAEIYFKRYAKQKRTLEAIKPQLDIAKNELEYYLSVKDEIELCETEKDLDEVLKEVKPTPQKKGKKVESVSSRIYEKDGFIIRVGRSNVENDKLVAAATRDSIWLHVKDYHSSHAIIEASGREVPIDIIKFGAELVAYYSKCRDTDKAEVAYTKRKYVKKPSGAKPGFVTYDNFKSIVVVPNRHEEFIKAD